MADSPDDEVTVPRAALNKMMKEILPHVRVAGDARELILNCCTEFVHLISSEANEICNKQMKKTISPEHVLAALESLGFGAYMSDCKSALEECKNVAAKKRRGSNRLENLGIPEEELLRQQQELFEKARLEQAAIEHQEWLQLQAAQMQQQGGQFLPGSQPPFPVEQSLPGAAGLPFQGQTVDQDLLGQISEQPVPGQDRIQTGSNLLGLTPSEQTSPPSGPREPSLANVSEVNPSNVVSDKREPVVSSTSSGESATVPVETAGLTQSSPAGDVSENC